MGKKLQYLVIYNLFIYMLCAVSSSCANLERLVYIIPPSGLESEALYDLEHPFRDRDDCLRYLVELRRALVNAGYTVMIGDFSTPFKKKSIIITSNIPSSRSTISKLKKSEPRVLLAILTEPPSVYPKNYDQTYTRHFDALLTMDDRVIDNKKYFKLCFPLPKLDFVKQHVPFHKKKFCTMIVGNKTSTHPYELYSERRKTINFFSRYYPQDFDLYGKGWSKIECPLYKGGVADKTDVLPDYKFCICYENIRSMKGYVTEKIFDAFINRCVPVYWGAPNITDYIPANCFIDRRKFSSHQALYKYLKSIDQATYDRYLASIEQFLKSKKARRFSLTSFNKAVLTILSTKNREGR